MTVTKQLIERYNLFVQIQNLLFQNDENDKFFMNGKTGKISITPKYIDQLQIFTHFKNLIANTADNTLYVDVSLIQSFIEQVFIKVSIFVTKKAHGDLTTDKTESEYFL